MKKLIFVLVILALLITLFGTTAITNNNKIEIKNYQLTTDSKYDRNPSVFRANDNTYWLFFARGRNTIGIRDVEGYNPDSDYYDIYFKTAKSIPGLQGAEENVIPLTPPNNAQRDISALQTSDGKIWVFTSTGLGEGTQREIYYYTYEGTWAGPTSVSGTDYAAHISILEYNGKIWVFFDVGYTLKVVAYDESTETWGTPLDIVIAGTIDATIAKAIVEEGKFYIVWTTSSGTGIYLSTSTDGITWSSTASPIASWTGATNWDPVLIKDKNLFRLFWAPDIGNGGQFIATTTSTDPTNTSSWSTPVQITTASYEESSWWDFWPQPYTKGIQELFYTSERNAEGTDRADGNIWMMHMN